MHRDAAQEVVVAVQRVGVHDARRHLRAGLTAASEQAPARAAELLATLVPGQRRHQQRIARLLQSWYVEVYRAAVDEALGQGGPVEDGRYAATAAAVATNLGARTRPDSALLITTVVWRQARLDGATAARDTWADLDAAAVMRAAELIPHSPLATEVDQARQEILRQWYRRVVLAETRLELGLATPLAWVSDAEAIAVAEVLVTGQPCRLVGTDGLPLMTAHGTATADADRCLDAGHTGVVDAPLEPGSPRLRHAAAVLWRGDGDERRRAFLARDVFGLRDRLSIALAQKSFEHLCGAHQTTLMAVVRDTDAAAQVEAPPFEPTEKLSGSPTEAAAAMFGLCPPQPDAATRYERLTTHLSPNQDARSEKLAATAAAALARAQVGFPSSATVAARPSNLMRNRERHGRVAGARRALAQDVGF